MAKKNQDKSIWGKLEYPNEFINSPDPNEGKLPIELYVKKHKVAYKVKYDQTKEKVIKTAPPKFILETTTVDYGLIFDNGVEIKGVSNKFWNEVAVISSEPPIVKKIRPKIEKIPKLNQKSKSKKNEGPSKG